MDKDDSYYDDIIRLIQEEREKSSDIFYGGNIKPTVGRPRFDEHDPESEVFMTSEDLIREREKDTSTSTMSSQRNVARHPIEETVYTRFTDINRAPKFSQETLDALAENCKRVIVHDYSQTDFYHLSDEEIRRSDQLATMSIQLGKIKWLYRSVSQYVEAMRVVYDAWSLLADTSIIHSRKEFFDHISDGIIVSNRIIIPKLQGINKYNSELILRYIDNRELDPNDLLPTTREEPESLVYQESKAEHRLQQTRFLNDDELQRVDDQLDGNDTSEPVSVKPIPRKYLKGYDDSINKRRKKGSKKVKLTQNSINAILRQIQRNNYQRSGGFGMAYGITENFFADTTTESSWDRNRYDGSWQNGESVGMYELAMDEERLTERLPYDTYMTYGDLEMKLFYRTLEEHGINVVELRRIIGDDPESYQRQRRKDIKRSNKKVESELINRIEKLSRDPKFKKLVKRSEKELEKYNVNQLNYNQED